MLNGGVLALNTLGTTVSTVSTGQYRGGGTRIFPCHWIIPSKSENLIISELRAGMRMIQANRGSGTGLEGNGRSVPTKCEQCKVYLCTDLLVSLYIIIIRLSSSWLLLCKIYFERLLEQLKTNERHQEDQVSLLLEMLHDQR